MFLAFDFFKHIKSFKMHTYHLELPLGGELAVWVVPKVDLTNYGQAARPAAFAPAHWLVLGEAAPMRLHRLPPIYGIFSFTAGRLGYGWDAYRGMG